MAEELSRLTPAQRKGHTSVARVTDDWYIACASDELGRHPMAVTLLGQPLVLYRGQDNRPGALLDRCAHRNVPLSIGRVTGSRLQCRYHGWEYDREGACRFIPGLCEAAYEKRGRQVPAFACREQDGFVWVYARPDAEPDRDPFRFPYLEDSRYTTIRQVLDVEASVHAAAENALDVPHTAYLHQGLFRGNRDPQPIEVVVRRWHDRVEAEYLGEPRPEGLVGRALSPSGGVVTHFDRFILPSIAQVDYGLGQSSHVCISNAMTPIHDFYTRMYAVVSFRLPVPGWTIVPALKPIAMRILKQDAEVLRRQTESIRRFGGEQYVSTEIDVLGPHISKLLRSAERGERTPVAEPVTKRVQMRV